MSNAATLENLLQSFACRPAIGTADAALQPLMQQLIRAGLTELPQPGQGRTLERTPGQPFHMVRISLAQKRMVKPCTKTDYGVRPECPLKDKPVEEKDIPFVPFL